jgi:YWFCY protein
MDTGENMQSLRHTLDLIRFGSILVLLIHFYSVCYPAIKEWGLTAPIVDKVIHSLTILNGITGGKVISLGLPLISLSGVKGKKDEHLRLGPVLFYILIGLLLFFISSPFLFLEMPEKTIAVLYISVTSIGYFSILSGGAKVSRLLHLKLKGDVFNDLNETFPQEERLLTNEDSINLPTQYKLKGKIRRGYINVVSPYRSTIVAGTAGAGKSFYVIRNFITQMISKQFTFFVYDFKFPDLTSIVYNSALQHASKYGKQPKLYIINFDDLSRSHRCNAIPPETMFDITDATESSRTIMLA